MVEHQPSKLNVAGSNPVSRFAAVAQLVEHVLGKDEVTSSILVSSSMIVFLNQVKELEYVQGEIHQR